VTLSSTSGTIPVTVDNGLDQPVVLGIDVVPSVATRLRVEPVKPVTIGAHRKQTFEIAAQATANGITRVDVQLVTQAGTRYGPVVPLRVNATNYGRVGLIVVIAAAAVLFVAAALRNIQRYRATHHSAEDTASGDATVSAGPGTTQEDAKIQA
jgi:hypothetical protein